MIAKRFFLASYQKKTILFFLNNNSLSEEVSVSHRISFGYLYEEVTKCVIA